MLHARRRGPDETASEGLPAGRLEGPRLAVSAARRFPSAITRNRARRVIREAARVLLRDVQDPWDLLLVVRPEETERRYPDRLGALAELFQRAGVIVGQEHAPSPRTSAS